MNFSINWGNRDDFVRSRDGGQKYIEVNEKSSGSDMICLSNRLSPIFRPQ